MISWNVCRRTFAIAFLLIATAELFADEPVRRQPRVNGQPAAAGKAPAQDTALRDAIEAVFRAQQDAWNLGNVEAFMDHYWKSDDLTFSSGGKTTRGWQATLARYRERYPTREQIGRLTLSGFEITPLGDAAALVLGEWKLDRESEPVGGNFTLVFRKLDGRWVIVHDHTSRLEK